MTEVYFPTDHTAAEWSAMAGNSSQSAADSFDRCDTDGFLSQWASGCMSALYGRLADLAETGGRAQLRWLIDTATGQPVENWKWIETRYGSSVLIPGEGYGNGKFFNPSHAKKGADRLTRDQAKGYHWGLVETDAVVFLTGSNALAVRPTTQRKKGSPLTLIALVDDRAYGRDH